MPIHHRFELYQRIATLGIKAKKCIVIPLGQRFTPQLYHATRTHITRLIPTWGNMNIAPSGKYLGFQVGPLANNLQWNGAVHK